MACVGLILLLKLLDALNSLILAKLTATYLFLSQSPSKRKH